MKNLFLAISLLYSAIAFPQYSVQWQKIDSLELEGRVESAGEIVSDILKTAREKEDYEQLIKANIYEYKFYQINHENSDQFILKDLNHNLAQLPMPYRNVLQSHKGRFLQQYYHRHRWRINRRKAIDNPDPTDLATWSEETLQDSIRTSYENSLQHPEQLIITPVEKFSELLNPEPLNRKYKPTLYDLLAYEALDYFKDPSNFPALAPAEEYAFNDPALYGPTAEFQQIEFPEAAQHSSEVYVLETFQKLEDLHSEDKDPVAMAYTQLQRLEYVNSSYRGPEKWEKYTQALDRLLQKYQNTTAAPLLLYTRAVLYFERAGEKDEQGELLYPHFNTKAVELGEKIIEEFPNSEMEQRAFSLISAIKAVELDVQIADYHLPQKASRMLLFYKSIDSVQVKIFRVPAVNASTNHWNFKYEIEELVENQIPLFSKSLTLPHAGDFNFHSTEAIIPPLEIGTYVLHVSGENSFGKKGYSFGFLRVTNLSLSQTAFEELQLYRILDRTTGFPEDDVQLTWMHKGTAIRERKTDKKGELFVEKNRTRTQFDYLLATKGKDTLITHYWEGSYRNENDKKDPLKAKTLLYLDRAIYRPGQKVHFKGVLLSHKNGETRTVPNEYVEVYVEDPNYEEVTGFRLKTNKYGSFHGEFLLPKNGITGSFYIYTEEDTESETDFWEEIWDEETYQYEEVYFSVEEYKRPTFEVSMDSIKKSYSFGDSIQVSGTAKAFMGAPVNNARVIYTVNRREMVYRWWYYDRGEFTSIKTDTVQTDEKGRFSLEFPAEVSGGDLNNPNLIYEYNIEATVTDISGESREGSTSLKIGRKNLLLKLELPEDGQRGDTLRPNILATNLNDQPVPVSGKLRSINYRGRTVCCARDYGLLPKYRQSLKKNSKNSFPKNLTKTHPNQWPGRVWRLYLKPILKPTAAMNLRFPCRSRGKQENTLLSWKPKAGTMPLLPRSYLT